MKKKYCVTIGEVILTTAFDTKMDNVISMDEAISPVFFNKALKQRKTLRKELDSRILGLFRLLKSSTEDKEDKRLVRKLIRLVRLQQIKINTQIKELSKFRTYYRF